MGLVAAVDDDVEGDIPGLDTDMDVVVVLVVVVIGVEEKVLELDAEEFSSSAARFLSFKILLWLFFLLLAGGVCPWGH